MPTITHTDYLAQVSGNGLVALPGLWVRLRNNSTSTDYFSTAVSDAQGAFTHSAVPGDYSAYTGTAATVVGTPTLRNAHYAVPVTAGDDAVLGSATLVVSSPYAPLAGLPAGSIYGAFQNKVQSIPYAASITPDASLGSIVIVGALTGNLTVNAPTNPQLGQTLTLLFLQDATGSRTVTLNAIFKTGWSVWYEPANWSSGGWWYDGTQWQNLPGNIATDQLGSSIIPGTLQIGDPAGAYGAMQLHTVPGFHGRQLELIGLSTDNLHTTGFNIVPGSAISRLSSTAQILIYNQTGTNYERFGITNTGGVVVMDSTVNGTGTVMPIEVQMGGSVSNSITSRASWRAQTDGSLDLIGSKSFVAQTKTWYAQGLRVVDPENQGTVWLLLDTRTGTPASNAADSSGLKFARGGATKWTVGLNVNGTNADNYENVAAATGGKFVIVGNSTSTGQHLQLNNTAASGHTWDVGEINVAGSLSFRDLTQTGAPEVIRLATPASGVNLFQINAAAAGAAPSLQAFGASTDIDVRLTTKGAGVVDLNYATVALGGGAAPTVGTIGGSGPATAAQNSWLKVKVAGTISYIPIWR